MELSINPEDSYTSGMMFTMDNEVLDFPMLCKLPGMKRKRGQYNFYMPRQRAEIGKYAVLHGVMNAVRHYSQVLNLQLNESTVRAFRAAYMKELQRVKDPSKVFELPKKAGRPIASERPRRQLEYHKLLPTPLSKNSEILTLLLNQDNALQLNSSINQIESLTESTFPAIKVKTEPVDNLEQDTVCSINNESYDERPSDENLMLILSEETQMTDELQLIGEPQVAFNYKPSDIPRLKAAGKASQDFENSTSKTRLRSITNGPALHEEETDEPHSKKPFAQGDSAFIPKMTKSGYPIKSRPNKTGILRQRYFHKSFQSRGISRQAYGFSHGRSLSSKAYHRAISGRSVQYPYDDTTSDDDSDPNYKPPQKRVNRTTSQASSTVTSSTQLAQPIGEEFFPWDHTEDTPDPNESTSSQAASNSTEPTPLNGSPSPSGASLKSADKSFSKEKKNENPEKKKSIDSLPETQTNNEDKEDKVEIEPQVICQVDIQSESDNEKENTNFTLPQVQEYHGNALYDSNEGTPAIEQLAKIYSHSESSSSEWSEEESNSEFEGHHYNRRVWTTKFYPINIKPFQGLPPGPTILPVEVNELNFFLLFFPEQLIQDICHKTNSYAQYLQKMKHRHDPKWRSVSLTELKTFLGIHILMGVTPRQDPSDYWSNDEVLCCPFISKVMSWNRFSKIEQYFQVSDPKPDSGDFKSRENQYHERSEDTLHKVCPVVDCLLEKISMYYNLHREIIITEMQIKTQTLEFDHERHYHIPSAFCAGKVYVLADAITGYIQNVFFNIDNSTDDEESKSLRQSPHQMVFSLIQPFLNIHHHLYIGKNFTSLKLFEDLLVNGVYACGLCRSSRKGFPKALQLGREAGNPVRNLARGEYLARQSENVVALVWRDHSFMNLLSTMFNARRTPNTPDFCGCDTFSNDHISLNCPPPVYNFQKYMIKGTWENNLRYFNNVNKLSHKCWKYYIWFCLEVAINNAFILWRDLRDSNANRKTFQINIAKALIEGISFNEKNDFVSTPVEAKISENKLPIGHDCVLYRGRPKECHECKIIGRMKGNGRCRETQYGCRKCGIRLCKGNCFTQFHQFSMTKTNFINDDDPSSQDSMQHPSEEEMIKNNLSQPDHNLKDPMSKLHSYSQEGVTEQEQPSDMVKDKDLGYKDREGDQKSNHTCVYFGRSRLCIQCSVSGILTESGQVKESLYGCAQCNVHLCQEKCFKKFHQLGSNFEVGNTSLPTQNWGITFGDHNCVRFDGRPRMCRQCKRVGRLTGAGRPRETCYGCDLCNINLCRGECFFKFHQNIDTSLAETLPSTRAMPPIPGHDCVQFEGRPQNCHYCKMIGRLTSTGRPRETCYGCQTCSMNLCRGDCFYRFHQSKETAVNLSSPLYESESIEGHLCVKLEDRARMCQYCRRVGRRTHSGRPRETCFGCETCGLNLCRGECFSRFHLDPTLNPMISSSTGWSQGLENGNSHISSQT